MTSIGMGQSLTTTVDADRLRPVRIWLYCIALMVLLMVAVGGMTRLTGSGLSIATWQPISGAIPPLNAASWQAEFDNYKQIPQFQVDNPGMTMDGFKAIFWPEWSHRLLGRLIGLAFAVPFLVFLLQIAAGAFVAGLDAGMGYNTWPLMDGAVIPDGLGIMQPLWRNLFENALTVQFVHRCIAYVIVLYLALAIWRQSRNGGFAGVNRWLLLIAVFVLLQACLGIATLLFFVPIGLAVGHQALAFMLAGLVIAYLADLRRATR
jgi:heme A synthase